MNWLDHLQWPAMATTVTAAWLAGSQRKFRRWEAFICFLGSNVLWGVWGVHDRAWGLVVLQLCLAVVNIRGLRQNLPTGRSRPGAHAG